MRLESATSHPAGLSERGNALTNPRDDKIEEIANIARHRAPAAQASYLDEACGQDAELRGDVERLLRHEFVRAAGTDAATLATQAPTQPAAGAPSGDIPQPLQVNDYRILDVLGEGSMGVVYRAAQQNPHRDVALKVLKPGGASDASLKRFEQEGQMLGRLQHPGIAQIFEAGTSDAGYGPQPFFAMELIRGLPLNEFAVKHALGTRARLEVLIKVCDGVEHAHQKGVIHRDLKPGNILIDKSGQPKILDFGIALAIDQASDPTVSPPGSESLTGTIPYMSFEQVKGKPGDLDTRTDVYALGVIGYQLLGGCLPHDLSRKSISDAIRIISQEVPRPLGEINKAFRGDLDIIITKALERQKSDRYPTASALAEDLRRYMADEPILARPPSSAYVLKKFAQRNKAIVLGSVALLLTLAAGSIALTKSNLKTEIQRVRAEEQGARAEERTARAHQAVQRNQATADTLFDVFLRTANPENTDKRVTVLEALDQVAARINDGTRRIEPENEAAVHLVLGKSYRVSGLLDKAEPHLVAALRVDRRDWGSEDPQTLADMDELALLYQARGKFAKAEKLFRAALETRRRVLGLENRKTLETQHNLALLLNAIGQSGAAEQMYREILEIQHRVLPEEDRLTLKTTKALAVLLQAKGKLADAERLYLKTLEIQRRTLGDDDSNTLLTANNLASLLKIEDKLPEAGQLYRMILEAQRHVLGQDHPDTLRSANNLAALLKAEGKLSDAETLYRQTLNTRRRVLGDDHPDTLTSMNNLAIVLRAQRKWDEANTLYRETMASLDRKLGAGHPRTLTATMNFATFLREQGKLMEAEKLYRRTLESLRSKPGDRHLATINAIYSLAVLLVQKGEYDEAEPLLREALGLWREVLPVDHPDIAVGAFKLGEVLLFQGDYGAAEPLLRECLTLRRQRLKPGAWKTANAQNALGDCVLRLGWVDEAEPLLVESYPVLKAKFGQSEEHTTRAIRRLVRLYDALGEPGRAAEYRGLLPDHAGESPAKNLADRP